MGGCSMGIRKNSWPTCPIFVPCCPSLQVNGIAVPYMYILVNAMIYVHVSLPRRLIAPCRRYEKFLCLLMYDVWQ